VEPRFAARFVEWPVVDVHLRMSTSQMAKLDALAERAATTRSGLVRRLIDAAATDVRVPGERLTEAELLDLLHEQARAGRTAAIVTLLRRGDQRDSIDQLLEEIFDGRAG
jgi:hypothetical protein